MCGRGTYWAMFQGGELGSKPDWEGSIPSLSVHLFGVDERRLFGADCRPVVKSLLSLASHEAVTLVAGRPAAKRLPFFPSGGCGFDSHREL